MSPCDVQYERHSLHPNLIAVCVLPKGHEGEHSNVLQKSGRAEA